MTAEHTPVRTAKKLSIHIKRVLQVYYRAGIKVRYVLMDGEFEKVKEHLPEIVCNTTVAKEHVVEAERERDTRRQGEGARHCQHVAVYFHSQASENRADLFYCALA